MTDADLDDMFRLLGDAEVMRYYPRAKSRNEAQRWINWSKDNDAKHGFGLWVIEHRTTGDFIGDCGLRRGMQSSSKYGAVHASGPGRDEPPRLR